MAKKTNPARRRARAKPVQQRIRSYAASAYCEQILDAAERVFLEAGYHEAKMSDLARAAGVSIGTLYNYFDSKERVFANLVERGRGEFLESLRTAAAAEGLEARIVGIVCSAFDYAERRGALFALYLQLGALTENDIRRAGGEQAEAGYLAYLGVLRDALDAAVKGGLMRADFDTNLLVGALAGAANQQIFYWVRGGCRGPLKSQGASVVQLFLEGARAR